MDKKLAEYLGRRSGKTILPKGMCFLVGQKVFNEILNKEFKNPEIIRLATVLGEFPLDGYTLINANRADKNNK